VDQGFQLYSPQIHSVYKNEGYVLLPGTHRKTTDIVIERNGVVTVRPPRGCHIHHHNHTDLFWNEVDKVMPDYLERKIWLKKHGAGLDV
jgi:hypothetical protein